MSDLAGASFFEDTFVNDEEPFEDSGSEYVPSDASEDKDSDELLTTSDHNVESEGDNFRNGIYLRESGREGPEIGLVYTFDKFYALGDHNLQTSYLCGQIKLLKKVRCTNAESKRNYTRVYYLQNEHGVDIPTLCVSDGRVTRALKPKQLGHTPNIDRRGRKEPYNKTDPKKVDAVVEFINKIPKYQSHYSRQKNLSKLYLAPTLNMSILYKLYRTEYGSEAVSQFVFQKIFKTKFNLSFHPPVTDSCKLCDILTYTTFIYRCLLLQETVVDILSWHHNLSTKVAHMYVWNESQGSRGPQEIGTCLLHYTKHFVTTSKLIMYSDQCGGQNRNIKIALLCKYILEQDKPRCIKLITNS
nr:unnamed protein product [Callosobruchus analis]